MKFLIIKDKKIKQDQLDSVWSEFAGIITSNTGIIPTVEYKEKDFSDYPKEMDSDGDEHLPDSYLRELTDEVWEEYKDSVDNIVIHIHRDNWNMAGIWGTNYSNTYAGYQLHVCRFDNRNLANSLGTLYHEFMHCVDAVIKTYEGTDVNKLGQFPAWDKYIVHGGRPDQVGVYKWSYIRHKENQDVLAYVGPYLRIAYMKRDKMHKQKKLINLLERLVVLLRAFNSRKSTLKK